MERSVEIFDSTLRDGAQGEGISFSVEDKLAIVQKLDELGVTFIEAGNPGSNPKDLEFFRRYFLESSSIVKRLSRCAIKKEWISRMSSVCWEIYGGRCVVAQGSI